MKRGIVLSLCFVMVMVCGWKFHPYHVSILNIDHTNGALQMTMNMAWEDTDRFLKHYNSSFTELEGAFDKAETDSMIVKYLETSVKVVVNGKAMPFHYIGKEQDHHHVYTYLEIQGVEKLESLEIQHTFMVELEDEQSNMVHLLKDGSPHLSVVLNKQKTSHIFDLKNE